MRIAQLIEVVMKTYRNELLKLQINAALGLLVCRRRQGTYTEAPGRNGNDCRIHEVSDHIDIKDVGDECKMKHI